jgi:HTH-type transcriptional regulator/antitoxin HigA
MPILNNRDYRLAKAKLLRLKRAMGASMSVEQLATNLSDEATAARRAALELESAGISSEIENYEKLQNPEGTAGGEFEIVKLGLLPIISRIRKRLSQKQLAELLGMKEQQVQRYERERYASISLKRLEEIFDILGVELKAHIDASSLEPKDLPKSHNNPSAISFSKPTLREIKKRSWLGSDSATEESIIAYLSSGVELGLGTPQYRRSIVENRSSDLSALIAWQTHVALEARKRVQAIKTKFNFADMGWLQVLVKLSAQEDGPRQAAELLGDKGICLIIEPHLPGTYLDGAAFLLADRTPVIGLTLRYDRIDYFWFTLLHELAHIFLHYGKGLENGFFDDFDEDEGSDLEKEADGFARSVLIPDKLWNASAARFSSVAGPILNFAKSCGIHPAIIVGRIQRERSDFKLFRNLLGQGTVRKLFE